MKKPIKQPRLECIICQEGGGDYLCPSCRTSHQRAKAQSVVESMRWAARTALRKQRYNRVIEESHVLQAFLVRVKQLSRDITAYLRSSDAFDTATPPPDRNSTLRDRAVEERGHRRHTLEANLDMVRKIWLKDTPAGLYATLSILLSSDLKQHGMDENLKSLLQSLPWAPHSAHHSIEVRRVLDELCPAVDFSEELSEFNKVCLAPPQKGSPKQGYMNPVETMRAELKKDISTFGDKAKLIEECEPVKTTSFISKHGTSPEEIVDRTTKLETVALVTSNELRPYMSYLEVTKFLNIKLSTLYSMVSRKQIPHHRINKRAIRFRRDELEAWLSSNAVAVQPSAANEDTCQPQK